MNGLRANFSLRQNEKMTELLRGPEPKTRKEKDLWNLRYLRYSIKYGSFNFRNGMISTLDRMIKMLEKQEDLEC